MGILIFTSSFGYKIYTMPFQNFGYLEEKYHQLQLKLLTD